MDIVIEQEDIVYHYKCYEQCCDCPIRYVCYTTKAIDSTIHLRGYSYLDLLVLRARLAFIIGNQEYQYKK